MSDKTWMVSRKFYPTRAPEYWIWNRRVSWVMFFFVALWRRDGFMCRSAFGDTTLPSSRASVATPSTR